MSGRELPEVASESYIQIAPDLKIKVLVLSDGQRIIPEEDMVRACAWLGIDTEKITPDILFKQ